MRAAGAAETRRRVVGAATASFLDVGYAATTLTSIAGSADVSVDTVYKTFGSKIALLKEVLDVVIGGDDDPVPMLQRSGPQAVRAENDQCVQVRMLAHGVTAQLERIRPLDDILRGAAAVDPEAAALREDIQVRQRGTAMRTHVRWIAENGPLRDGLTVARAGQVVWALTSPEVHRMLRDTSGWSRRAYEAWLEQAIGDGILDRSLERRGVSRADADDLGEAVGEVDHRGGLRDDIT